MTERSLHAAAELFCSYQAERLSPRAKYLEIFSAITDKVDLEKFQNEALEQLCDELQYTVTELCHKFEIINSYAKILFLTKSHPNLIKNHFAIGISLRFEPEQPDLLSTAEFSNFRFRSIFLRLFKILF